MNKIDQELCKKCMLCTQVCPCNIIGVNEHKEVFFIPERKAICLECGQCMAVCKSRAIRVNGLDYTSDFRELPEAKWQLNEYTNFVSGRRSVRNFLNKPVPDELINRVLDPVCYAPFGAAPEKMCITVVNSRERIVQALPHIEKFLDKIVTWIENPVIRYILKRKNGPELFNTLKNHLYPISKLKNYKLEYGDRITRNAPALIIFHAEEGAEAHSQNSMIYAIYTMLAAHALGLGATLIEIVPAAINRSKEVREVFDIPDTHEASMSLILGYPRFSYQRTVKRRKHSIRILS
jgi:nitroreductase/NAD-dependent dihydropyrimidine dehydrogenase PreA subunit